MQLSSHPIWTRIVLQAKIFSSLSQSLVANSTVRRKIQRNSFRTIDYAGKNNSNNNPEAAIRGKIKPVF